MTFAPSAPAGRHPPSPLRQAVLGRVGYVFSDVDGTLTSGGRLRASTVDALEALDAASVQVVLVSGRPAGFGEAWARALPVRGVIVENGALYFAWTRRGRLVRRYAQPLARRRADRARLSREVSRVLRAVPGARLSTDSAYTEVDLAVDYNEDARLGARGAARIEALLRARGVTAVRSSVHVNCWIGRFDKLSALRTFLRREQGLTLGRAQDRLLYVGDSFNDEPLFGALPLSVGVANVREVLGALTTPPAFITRAPGGQGFEELARAVLLARAKARAGAPASRAGRTVRRGEALARRDAGVRGSLYGGRA